MGPSGGVDLGGGSEERERGSLERGCVKETADAHSISPQSSSGLLPPSRTPSPHTPTNADSVTWERAADASLLSPRPKP